MGTKFDDSEFIKLVERFPCLYNKRDKHYKNIPVVQNTWKLVSDKFKVPVDFCIQRWANIRHRYAKERRKIRNQTTGGDGCSTWPHYGDCSFLDEVVLSRRTSSNILYSIYKNRPSSTVDIVKTESITIEDPLIQDVVLVQGACLSETRDIFSGLPSDNHRIPSCSSERTASTPSPSDEVHHRKTKKQTEDIPMSASSTINKLDGQDEDMLFGRSIGLTLKKVTSQKNKLAAKSKIMMVLSEYVDSD